ncbi:MAG: hypothetical protein CMP10_20655 [Zetaproteobacteria bacterium]|nr:hypothetical protein [Pseudobdellovibrionaceae bacterium]|tara:strand:- start:57 stop:680 length:624 start_codon:yes stop_codon:yes gene_type:complete
MKNYVMAWSLIILLGCEDKETTQQPEGTDSIISQKLTGTWSCGCRFDEDSNYSTESITIVATSEKIGNMERIKSYWGDNNCNVLTFNEKYETTYKIRKQVDEDGSTWTRDETITSISVSFILPNLINAANTDSYYGYNTWVKNQYKDVSGKRQTPGSTRSFSAAGASYYTVFKIENNKYYRPDFSTANPFDESVRPTKTVEDYCAKE